MMVLERLATASGNRDEKPNIELAEEIARTGDREAVRVLVENLSNRDRRIQSDCIKVLYEIGERNPELIADHHAAFARLLGSSNNRLAWGAMTALDAIAPIRPKELHPLLPAIVAAARSGSVITRDHAVGIIAALGSIEKYARECAPLLIAQLAEAPDNQLPMYAEKSLPAITATNREEFRRVLAERMDRLPKESQRKRVAKVLKRIDALSS